MLLLEVRDLTIYAHTSKESGVMKAMACCFGSFPGFPFIPTLWIVCATAPEWLGRIACTVTHCFYTTATVLSNSCLVMQACSIQKSELRQGSNT